MRQVRQAAIGAAADKLLEAALLGEGWSESLSGFADAAAARGAVLIGELVGDKPHCKVKMTMVATPSIADHIADYSTGRIPPDPRLARVRPKRNGGFLTDFDTFSPEELARNDFYAGYLRSVGLGWHACAFLNDWSGNHSLYINLKRDYREGHYEPDEIAIIDRAVPTLRIATAIWHARVAGETEGFCQALGANGEAIFELDSLGRVVRFDQAASCLLAGDLALNSERLAAGFPDSQQGLDRALAAALTGPAGVGFAVLPTGTETRRLLVRTARVPGFARDVYGGAAALAIVSALQPPDVASPRCVKALRETFGITETQAEVATLIGGGLSPNKVAQILAMAEGTARNHLKSAMARIGVHRQAELATLVARLSG